MDRKNVRHFLGIRLIGVHRFLKCKNDERGKNSVKSVEADKYMTSVMAGN
ncbi:hypothetical protein ACIP97_19380 [Peribacillus frigoritolerans]